MYILVWSILGCFVRYMFQHEVRDGDGSGRGLFVTTYAKLGACGI